MGGRAGGLRAYAVGVAELEALVGASPAEAARFRALVHASAPRPTLRDRLGPLHRRVPGSFVDDDEPAPADLDALLAGGPVRPERAAATWRLVETVAAALAWGSVTVAGRVDGAAFDGLRPLALAVPAAAGLRVGWCPTDLAPALPVPADWLADLPGWADAAARAGRPRPDVVCFLGP